MRRDGAIFHVHSAVLAVPDVLGRTLFCRADIDIGRWLVTVPGIWVRYNSNIVALGTNITPAVHGGRRGAPPVHLQSVAARGQKSAAVRLEGAGVRWRGGMLPWHSSPLRLCCRAAALYRRRTVAYLRCVRAAAGWPTLTPAV
jgi:hypothetical protein